MLDFLTPVSSVIGISNADFAVVAFCVLFSLTLAALGSERSYSAFYGAVIGIGIYIVLQTLLSPSYQTADTSKIIGPAVSKFLIASAGYLIFILAVLTPINASIRIRGAKNAALRFMESMAVGSGTLALLAAVTIGFMNRTYVFTADTAFTLLKNSVGFVELLSVSKILLWIASHLQSIVLFSVLFAIYRAFFSDIVTAAVAAILSSALKRKEGERSEETEEPQDQSGHEEAFEDHSVHDDHGH